MSFETFIALRYLKTKKVYRFLSFLSLISLLGITVSVFSFIVIHSVMYGFSSHLRSALIGFNAHMTLTSKEEEFNEREIVSWLTQKKEVQEAWPVIEFDSILTTPQGMASGAKVRGTDFLKNDPQLQIIFFEDKTLEDLKPTSNRLPGLLIGEELYTRLKLFPGEEEVITVVFPFGEVGPLGEVEPRYRDFKIIGLFSTGFYDYDTRYVFMDKKEAHSLSGQNNKLNRILVRLFNSDEALPFKKKIQKIFPQLTILTWGEQNIRLFSALKVEKAGMFLLLSIVTFIACFNILALVTLLALHKGREMALFYALGITRKQMQSIYRRLGLFLGIWGTALGFAGGFVALYLLKHYPLPLPPAYYLDRLPIRIDYVVIVGIAFMAPIFSMLAALWPALNASKMNPMEILRAT